MLDIKYIRENAEQVKKVIASGRSDPEKADVDKLLKLDGERRTLMQEIETVNRERNELAKQKTDKSNMDEKRRKGKELKEKLQELEKKYNEVDEKWQAIMDWIPNIPVEMPEGKGEEDNIVIKMWVPGKGEIKEAEGKKAFDTKEFMPPYPVHAKEKDFKPKNHVDLGADLNIIDIEQSAKVSGSRFTYLLNEAVLLQYGLQQLMFGELLKRGFRPLIPPVLVKQRSLYGTSHFPEGRDQVYKLETEFVEDNQELYLVGSSEPTNFSYFMDKTLNEEDLPIKVFAMTSCFRSEVGSWGKDVRGIKRVHQFDKIEMNVVCKPDQSNTIFDELLSINEWLLQQLEIPYQLVLKCTGDAGYLASAKQIDPEGWLGGQQDFIELGTDTNTTDFQARRLNIKYKDKDGDKHYVHTVNDTGVAMGRMLIAIIDNYQQEDGSIMVPKVLRKFVDFERIEPKKDNK